MNLFEHQKTALEQTKDQNRVAYYLDMGLGKTFVGSEKMHDLDAKVNLVVCQKSKVQDWLDHFREYYDVRTYDLTKPKELSEFHGIAMGERFHCVGVINYDLIFRRPELSQLKDFTLMLDESSLIQNETSKRSKFILKKLNPVNAILLSGTPTGGKYEKLWSQCRLIGWKISKEAFWSTYVNFHWDDNEGFPRKVVDGYKNVERLKRKLREHGAVFMKSEEVFDLPAQIDSRIYVPTIPEYRKFKKDSIVNFQNLEFVGDTVLTKMLYERMLCGFANKDKLAALRDLLESTEDRVIIFYNFNNEFVEITNLLADLERPISIVSGDFKNLEVRIGRRKLLARRAIGARSRLGRHAEQVAISGFTVVLHDSDILSYSLFQDKAINRVEARVVERRGRRKFDKILRGRVIEAVATVRAQLIGLGVVLGQNR